MNYYPHHIGDYAAATAHLSILEHGVYRLLLDAYYESERPLSGDKARIYRRIRATTKAEKKAVDMVLEEFFEAAEDGFRHRRCDAEIASANDRRSKNVAAAGKRWRQQKSSSEEENPTKSTGVAMQTHSDGTANAMPTNPNTNPNKPPLPPKGGSGAVPAPDGAMTPGEVSAVMRRNGSQKAHPGNPSVISISESGVTAETLLAACEEGRRCQPDGFSPGYVLRILEGWKLAKGRAPDLRGVKAPGQADRDEIFAGAR